jgi:pilus assembly protein Flp/PilA
MNKSIQAVVWRLRLAICALRRGTRGEGGQDVIEYALVVGLLALAAAAGMSSVATKISNVFSTVGTKLATYTS